MDTDGSPLSEAGWLFAVRRSQLGGAFIVSLCMIYSMTLCGSDCSTPIIIAYSINLVTSLVTWIGVAYIIWSPRCNMHIYRMWVSVALDVAFVPMWLVSCSLLLYWILRGREMGVQERANKFGAFIFGTLNTILFLITSLVFATHLVRLYRYGKTISGAIEDGGSRPQTPTSPPPGYRRVANTATFGRRKPLPQSPISQGS